MKLEKLDKLVRAVCPIDGISADGEIWFSTLASDAQKAVAHEIMRANVSSIGVTTLAELRNEAIAATYEDVDAIYALAIGNRGEEYKQAEVDARAFKSAGYSGTVSPYVAGWAAVKGLTNQQSADAIIARADALAAAKLSMRNQRFTSQAAMQNAADQAQLDAAVAEWRAFTASIKTALGM